MQADEDGREPARLPETVEDELLTRLRGLLQSLKPTRLVGALASGSDILFARAALLESIPLRVLLPFAKEDFRKTSVESRGTRWLTHFDRIVSDTAVELVEGNHPVRETVEAFNEHNLTMLDDARALAEGTDERLWVITIRPTPNPEEPTVTDNLVLRAEERGHFTLDLSPIHDQLSAFIVMPYGVKKDVRSGKKVDCDPAFHRIYRPLLEDADISWNRADLETDSGIIHSGMIAALANSDLALVDLTAANFNVAYELGVRHIFADRSTVLVNPHVEGQARHAPPFDINMIRIHSFVRGQSISDMQAEDAIKALRPVVRRATAELEIDSPAHSWFDLAAVKRPFSQLSQLTAALTAENGAREKIGLAIKSSDPDAMKAAAEWLSNATGVHEGLRRSLRIELAIGLHAEEDYADARALLELSQPGLDDPLHRVWLQECVMVYRRLGEDERDPVARQGLWRTARGYLEDAETAGYVDSETYGSWGGLLKRELELQLDNGDPAVAKNLFREMAEKYRAGFEGDPSFYTGVNLLMALRLSGRDRDESFREEFNEILTVSRFLNKIAIADGPTDYWALATRAELTLHECLESGRPIDEAAEQFAEAVRHGRADQIRSTKYQLNFLARHGDPEEVIERLRLVIEQAR
ncbi:tetratricopeptide repeat-containing protein [Leucobacter sp. 7(1)]|uniref:tetratricopeptide repeat-containing protein n=1 Tax=Leucobacter sp. 7(1) TaxID=1255613 RepID=UPI00112153CD|nr:tetratricopeptide repeat-containing protein [Leucobacter sp. 7(1)]